MRQWGQAIPCAAGSCGGGEGPAEYKPVLCCRVANNHCFRVVFVILQASLGSFLSARDTYEPALPPRAVNRGLLQLGELARLRIFAHKLLQGGWCWGGGGGSTNGAWFS